MKKTSRRQPSEAEKAKYLERRERFRSLAASVAALSPEQRNSLVARLGAVVTVEGHPLSLGNTCLVLLQIPTASMVGGFQQWLKAGRAVQKGQHGCMIWIPTGRGKAGEDNPAADPEAAPERQGFVMGTVFDVSQTAPVASQDATTAVPA